MSNWRWRGWWRRRLLKRQLLECRKIVNDTNRRWRGSLNSLIREIDYFYIFR
jgi:hypothetical protein